MGSPASSILKSQGCLVWPWSFLPSLKLQLSVLTIMILLRYSNSPLPLTDRHIALHLGQLQLGASKFTSYSKSRFQRYSSFKSRKSDKEPCKLVLLIVSGDFHASGVAPDFYLSTSYDIKDLVDCFIFMFNSVKKMERNHTSPCNFIILLFFWEVLQLLLQLKPTSR